MTTEVIGPLKLTVELEQWPLKVPFRITNHTWENLATVAVTVTSGGKSGRGEAAGVYYKNDVPDGIARTLEGARAQIEAGVSRDSLRELLPPGGARNAIDCALWDLEAHLSGKAVWELAGLSRPKPLITTMTCGAESPETMAATALSYKGARAIKLKLTGEPIDAERVRAVRDAVPEVWLGIDGNQGFTRQALEKLLPVLVDARVSLIEQPMRIGEEAIVDGLRSPIPIAADESVQSLADFPRLKGRFQVINIKLDKCGGLTEGLAMARTAHDMGLDVMVGNMLGTSLAMAPAYILGQLCKVVDLDGPVFLRSDRPVTVEYRDGYIDCPGRLWGSA
jgi:L-alanine-DL-glutamate epimerase-like enolase superfamily enzyme